MTNLLVKTIEEEMQILKSSLTAEQTVQLIQFLVDKLEQASGIPHDEILDDLKYKENKENK